MMTDPWARQVEESLPLAVLHLEVTDPSASIAGDGWSLGLLCPWTLTGPEVAFDSELETLAMDRALEVLRGRALQRIEFQEDFLVDPVLHFSGGHVLSIRADSDLDPWVLQVNSLVLVGRVASS